MRNQSILDDVGNGKLNIDRVQEDQAKKEAKAVDDAMPRTARECYKWLLCPGSNDPGLREANIEGPYPEFCVWVGFDFSESAS
jgi:predicted AAA+ superfamily ATPase